jgi:pyrroloquinoline-quinone synthase
MSNTQLLGKIDAAIAEKNLLKHPFYQDWQEGKLSRESLQLYAAQYYKHVEASLTTLADYRNSPRDLSNHRSQLPRREGTIRHPNILKRRMQPLWRT